MHPALDIRNLRFRYSQRADAPWVLDIESLVLDQAEQMLLTGTSGTGKSTLLYLIAGLMEPNAGVIRVNGQDVHELTGEKRDLFRGQSIGMIFQTFNLLHGFTAMENVMMPMMFSEIPPKEHRERAAALLDELGLEAPNRQVEALSIGQQQRVAVARAIACEPAMVLADEPTASLDPANATAAMDLIQRTCVKHGAALLCTSHDPAMVQRFERQRPIDSLAQSDESASVVNVPD